MTQHFYVCVKRKRSKLMKSFWLTAWLIILIILGHSVRNSLITSGFCISLPECLFVGWQSICLWPCTRPEHLCDFPQVGFPSLKFVLIFSSQFTKLSLEISFEKTTKDKIRLIYRVDAHGEIEGNWNPCRGAGKPPLAPSGTTAPLRAQPCEHLMSKCVGWQLHEVHSDGAKQSGLC